VTRFPTQSADIGNVRCNLQDGLSPIIGRKARAEAIRVFAVIENWTRNIRSDRLAVPAVFLD